MRRQTSNLRLRCHKLSAPGVGWAPWLILALALCGGCSPTPSDTETEPPTVDEIDGGEKKVVFAAASGSNKPCQTTLDCPNTEICFEAAQQCRKACATDEQCPGNSVCSNVLGICVSCNDDTDCGTGHCHPELLGCVQCVTDEHCDGLGVCRQDTFFCVQCQKDEDCPTGHCSADRAQCVQCIEDNHCDDKDPCTNDLCLFTQTCFHPLVPPDLDDCQTNQDCADFVTDPCYEPICVPGECGSGTCAAVKLNQCADSCTSAKDCPTKAGYCSPTCVQSRCHYPEVHSSEDCQCAVASDCPAPPACNLTGCINGKCVITPKLDGTGCSDGEICTEQDLCSGGICKGTWAKCGDLGPCVKTWCEPQIGCQELPVSGVPCTDKNLCTSGDLCVGGQCVGNPAPCDDNNPCTVDLCAPGAGCFFQTAVAMPCDDNNPCTQTDFCEGGTCMGGSPACFDNNPCTADVCSVDGECSFLAVAPDTVCNDNDPCTEGDTCSAGFCQGTPKVCANPSVCAESFCDANGACKTIGVETGTNCNDGDLCTYGDACINGVCKGKKLLCTDENPCTEDTCKPSSGCVYLSIFGAVCDDDNPCTALDQCIGGECTGVAALCDDGNSCTTDKCEPGVGCVAIPVDDFTDCGQQLCGNVGVCVAGACSVAPVCDDDNPCTADFCIQGNLCQFKPHAQATACDDGNLCTTGDVCINGLCKGKPVLCEDSGPCVATKCDVDKGCLKFVAPDKTACNDENNCTASDMCMGGICAGIPIVCDDNNPCTKDACDFHAGCWHTHTNDGGMCTDGEPCTVDDTCLAGQCLGKSVSNCKMCNSNLDCADNNPCTLKKCGPGGVCLYGYANGQPCDDGFHCTTGDVCAGGLCAGIQQKGCEEPLCYPLAQICSGDIANANDCAPGYTCSCVSSCADCADCPLRVCLAKPASTYPLSLCGVGGDCEGEVASCQCVADPANGNECAATICAPKPNCECTADLDCAAKGLCGAYCDHGTCIKLDFTPECDSSISESCSQPNTKCLETTCGSKCFAVAELKPLTPCSPDTPSSCDDGNPCTDDLCDQTVGCTHVVFSNKTPCDDSDPCTVSDNCESGECGGELVFPLDTCCADVVCGDQLCTPSCETILNCPQDCVP